MNCKKCGNHMPDGARFCISCGAEHDSNGQLIVKNNKTDYNKTIMINGINNMGSGNQKIDYNKTMMAGDVSREKIDYNKTMMAGDVPHQKIDYNKTMMANDVSPNNNYSSSGNNHINSSYNSRPQNKKVSPLIIVITLIIIAGAVISVVFPKFKKQNNVKVVEQNNEKQNIETAVTEESQSGNVVSDFDANASGYWSKDYEFFYIDGVPQKNKWVGDYYLGDDGRKVRNKLIDDNYYVDANGQKVKNEWYKFNKKIGTGEVIVWYYLGPDGAKLRDEYSPDGFYLDKDGIYVQENNNTPDSAHYRPKK